MIWRELYLFKFLIFHPPSLPPSLPATYILILSLSVPPPSLFLLLLLPPCCPHSLSQSDLLLSIQGVCLHLHPVPKTSDSCCEWTSSWSVCDTAGSLWPCVCCRTCKGFLSSLLCWAEYHVNYSTIRGVQLIRYLLLWLVTRWIFHIIY